MKHYEVTSRHQGIKYSYTLELVDEDNSRLLIRVYDKDSFKYEEGALNSLLKRLGELAIENKDIRITWVRK